MDLIRTPATLFIRHGESEGNIGLPTGMPASIRLTTNGMEQAQALALRFSRAPDLIITSPYLRTQETAAPLMKRYPGTPMQVWPVQEYTYLNPTQYSGTTQTQRGIFAQSYWKNCDAHWNDGGGAESFAEFISRIDVLCRRLHPWRAASVAAFTHGYFIKGLKLRLQNPDAPVDDTLMAAFRDCRRGEEPRNAEIMTFPKLHGGPCGPP